MSPGGFPNEETEAQRCEIAWRGSHSSDEGELARTQDCWALEGNGWDGGRVQLAALADTSSSLFHRLEEKGKLA